MAAEWDLSAIVKSCQSATTTTATTEIPLTNTISTTTNTSNVVREEYDDMFCFPNLLQPITNEFQDVEVEQLLTPFNPTTTTTTSTSGSVGINPNSPDFEGCSIGQQQDQRIHYLPTDPSIIWPHHLVPQASTSSAITTIIHDQQQINQLQLAQKQEYSQVSQTSSSTVLPDTLQQPQTPRSRKRRSQQKRMVCQVSEDNLSADMWAWRKYGQKPIKGSPYPRNYYRCSSSKACCARKQVERSNEEANMFIITYTGDHNHLKPTHRNSLAGSTRSKSSTPPRANQSTTAAVAAAPPPPPAEHEKEEMVEAESPDPETETEVEPEGDSIDWAGFSPG